MLRVRMAAVMAAIIVIFFSSIGFADTEVGSGQIGSAQTDGASEHQVGTVGGVETPAETPTVEDQRGQSPVGTVPTASRKPVVSTPRWKTREGIEEATHQVLSRQHRNLHGRRGPQGPAGRPGRDHVPGHGNALSILHGQDPEHKHWNVVSGTYVDARDQLVLDKANAYTDGVAKGLTLAKGANQRGQSPTGIVPGHAPAPGDQPATYQPYDWGWLWWLLLLLIVAGLLWWWLVNRGPFLVNTARFGANRRFIGERSVRVPVGDGCRQDPEKAGRNRSAGDSSYATKPSRAFPGDIIRYRLRVRNNAHTSIPADEIWMSDSPDEGMTFVPGTGYAYINSWEYGNCKIPDEMMKQMLVEGKRFRMSDIPGMKDKLPANSSLYLVYELKVRNDDEDDEDEAEYVVPTPAPPEPEAEPAPAAPPETPAAPAETETPTAEPAAEEVATTSEVLHELGLDEDEEEG